MNQPHRPPPPPYVPRHPPSARPPGNWFTRGGWWFFVHVLTFGTLAVVPFSHAAAVSRRRGHAILAAGVALATVLWFTFVIAAPEDAAGHKYGPLDTTAAMLFSLIFLGGIPALVVVRQQVFSPAARARRATPTATTAAPSGTDPAMTRALAARKRREEARALVGSDPLLARELRVGRPDLPREYDDGGLVDLNGAPAPAIAEVCGLDPAQAGQVVQARQAAGRFSAVEDVFAWTELPVDVWDRIRDRAIVL